jgi:mitochondrial-processing peptidase subunit alpha
MSTTIDALGGQIMASSSRESMMYQSSHFAKGTPLAMSLIADTVLDPAFLPEELELQREAARYEIREITSKPEMIIPEILHEVAYDRHSLGNPLLCPEDRIDLIDATTIRSFKSELYRPERMVIAGAGVPHQELVELADKYFSSLKATPTPPQPMSSRTSAGQSSIPSHLLPSSNQSSSLFSRAASYLSSSPLVSNAPVSYTGGHRFIPDTESEFNHLYLAFEGFGIHDEDIYALATMQILLGGGGSFSAGTSPTV